MQVQTTRPACGSRVQQANQGICFSFDFFTFSVCFPQRIRDGCLKAELDCMANSVLVRMTVGAGIRRIDVQSLFEQELDGFPIIADPPHFLSPPGFALVV